jgi:hypothetical protein
MDLGRNCAIKLYYEHVIGDARDWSLELKKG